MDGLEEDLNLSDAEYRGALAILYASYSPGQLPSNLVRCFDFSSEALDLTRSACELDFVVHQSTISLHVQLHRSMGPVLNLDRRRQQRRSAVGSPCGPFLLSYSCHTFTSRCPGFLVGLPEAVSYSASARRVCAQISCLGLLLRRYVHAVQVVYKERVGLPRRIM